MIMNCRHLRRMAEGEEGPNLAFISSIRIHADLTKYVVRSGGYHCIQSLVFVQLQPIFLSSNLWPNGIDEISIQSHDPGHHALLLTHMWSASRACRRPRV